MNNQIEEMARDIGNSRNGCFQDDCLNCRAYGQCMYQEIAQDLFEQGYRKQIEGKWITKKHPLVGDYAITCSCCGHREHRGPAWNPSWVVHNFCPNCGAKMRKEDEGK